MENELVTYIRMDQTYINVDLENAAKEVETKTEKFKKSAEKVGKAIGNTFVDASAAVISLGEAFETSMAKASTLIDTTVTDMDSLDSKMLKLSDSSGVAASELGDALYSALSSGIPATGDMSEAMGLLEKSTRFAKAGFTDVNSAVKTTAQVLNSYGMSVSDTDKVQKILIQTQKLGNTSINELGSILAGVTPTASAMGVSFEQVGASLSVMTSSGIPAATAATQLNGLLQDLGTSGSTASDNLAKAAEGTKYAGMSFQDMMAAGVPLNDIMDMMGTYADASGSSMRDMFGNIEEGKAALSMAGENSEKYTDALAAMSTQTDVVGESYDKVSDTSAEKFSKAMNALKNMAIEVYEKGFKPLMAGLYDVGTWFADNSELFTFFAIIIGTITAAILAYNIVTTGAAVVTAIMGAAVDMLALPIVPVILVIGALIAAIYAIINCKKIFASVLDAFQKFASGAMAAFGVIRDFLANLWDEIVNGLTSAFGGIEDFLVGLFDTIVNGIMTAFEGIGDFLAGLLDTVVNGIMTAFEGIGDFLTDLFDTLISIIGTAFETIVAFLTGLLETIVNAIVLAFETIVAFFTGLLDTILSALAVTFETIVAFLTGLLDTILSAIAVAFETIGALLTGLMDGIISAITATFEAIGAFLTGLLDGISSAITTTFEAIGSFFAGLLDGIVNGFSYAFNGIMGIINGVVGFITGQIDCIKDAFNNIIDFIGNVFTGNWEGAWRNIINIFGDIVGGMGNMFKAPINFVVDLLNGFINGINRIEIPDWVPGIGGMGINIPKIPRLKVGMDYVPSDYFPAFLDKGESVLTAGEASIYRSLGGIDGIEAMLSRSANIGTSVSNSGTDDIPINVMVEGDIHTHVNLDSREIGEAVSPFVSQELAVYTKRSR